MPIKVFSAIGAGAFERVEKKVNAFMAETQNEIKSVVPQVTEVQDNIENMPRYTVTLVMKEATRDEHEPPDFHVIMREPAE